MSFLPFRIVNLKDFFFFNIMLESFPRILQSNRKSDNFLFESYNSIEVLRIFMLVLWFHA